MKRLCLLLIIAIALLVALPGVALAQEGITVISSSTVTMFPNGITFNLEAESDSEINNINLEYRINRLSLIPVNCRVDVDFTPGVRVAASWTWNMLETGGLPPGTEVEYRWLIEDASGHRIETSPASLKFDDFRYDWNSLTSDGITLYWYQGGESFAQELMDAAQEALQRLADDTGVSLEQAVSIYIYASYEDLLGALVFPYEWTGGVAFPDFGIIAIGIFPSDLTWGKRAMAHELSHLVVHQAVFGPYGDLPTWLDEGLAVYAEGEISWDRRSRLDEAISNDALISVRSLSSRFTTDPDEARLSYAESYSLVVFLLDNYGQDKMLQLLDVFKEGSGYDDALIQVYGFDMDGLNELWRASLGLGPQPTPVPEAGESRG
ncbi:MAG: peptidase MA domain-containing protein, partial [Dehalococcoidia bacterium]|nr:peptidase MA domain-containing protein [Dehalococcoidia bacterium]